MLTDSVSEEKEKRNSGVSSDDSHHGGCCWVWCYSDFRARDDGHSHGAANVSSGKLHCDGVRIIVNTLHLVW